MKFFERVLMLAILLLLAAIIALGFIEKRNGKTVQCADSIEATTCGFPQSSDKNPLEKFFKTPADDMADPLSELVFHAKENIEIQKSLADFERFLPKKEFAEIENIFKARHSISSEQSENGKLELAYPSLIALKVFDGKSAKEILECAEK